MSSFNAYTPYRSLGVIENNPGQYLMVKRKGSNLWSYVGGGELMRDMKQPIKTILRETFEESGIASDKISLQESPAIILTHRGKTYYVFMGKLLQIDPLPGYISHDEDIEYFQWMTLGEIQHITLTDIDILVYCWLYNLPKTNVVVH